MVKTGRSKTHSILIVDDEPFIRSNLCRILDREGLHCLLASNGEDALIFLKKRPVSVVFSDVVIPGGSGIELLSEIKQRYPLVSRVCLSGRVDQGFILPAIENGVVSYFLAKPWSNGVFKKTLRHALADFEKKSADYPPVQARNRTARQAPPLDLYRKVLLAGRTH